MMEEKLGTDYSKHSVNAIDFGEPVNDYYYEEEKLLDIYVYKQDEYYSFYFYGTEIQNAGDGNEPGVLYYAIFCGISTEPFETGNYSPMELSDNWN